MLADIGVVPRGTSYYDSLTHTYYDGTWGYGVGQYQHPYQQYMYQPYQYNNTLNTGTTSGMSPEDRIVDILKH